MYEAGLRAHLNQTYTENNEESSQLYANLSKIAASLPQSWNYGKPVATAESIGTAHKKNRMVCSPCMIIQVPIFVICSHNVLDPLLMNAFNNVNLAAACIVTTTEFARELGVPESRWIYPLGGAGTSDAGNCRFLICYPLVGVLRLTVRELVWERANFYTSPSISESLDAALEASKLEKQNIDLFDFYSYA